MKLRLKTQSKNLYGAFLIVLISLLTTLTNSLTHTLSATFPAVQILFLKSFIGFLVVSLYWRREIFSLYKTKILPLHFLKGTVGVLGNWFWIISLKYLPLADASALSLTSALLTSLGGYFVFKERPAWQVWGCIFCGFIGVALIVKPSHAMLNIAAFFPLLSALAFSFSSLLVKRMGDSSRKILWYLLLFMSLWSFLPALLTWQGPTLKDWVMLILIGGVSTLSHLALIEAYRFAEASFIAPFKFLRFPLSIFAGIFFFQETPTLLTLIGGSLIVGVSLYLVSFSKRSFKKVQENQDQEESS